MTIKYYLLLFLFFAFTNFSAISMPSQEQEELNTIGSLTRHSINHDDRRELFYEGIPLHKFPPINKEKYNLFCVDSSIGAYEAILEKPELDSSDPRQRLLLASPMTNVIVDDLTFSRVYDGRPPATLGDESATSVDRREIVPSPHLQPFSAIASLEIQFHTIDTDEGKHYLSTYFGSGALIQDRFILTAAHNLYDSETGYLANKVTAFPGLNYGKKYWDESSIKYYIHPEYMKTPSARNDIALVDFGAPFNKNPSQETHPFSFGIAGLPEEVIRDKELHVTGFPGGAMFGPNIRFLGCKIMMQGRGKIISASNGEMIYDIDTSKGNSGSPVYFLDEDNIVCCGVHAMRGESGSSYNVGSYIDSEKFNLIRLWINR